VKLVSFLFLYCIAGLLAEPVLAAPTGSASSNFLDERAIQKLAFVVGNSTYADQEKIPSSNVDAIKAAEALRGLGFAVTEVHDVKLAPDFWEIKFQPFLDQIKENDFVVVYFSGHGLNYRGENFVAMTNLPKTILESEITNYLVALSSMRQTVTSRRPGLSLFLLDACRSIASNIQKDDGTVEAVNKGPVPMRTTVENVAVGFSSDFGSISKGRDTPGVMSYYTDAQKSAAKRKRRSNDMGQASKTRPSCTTSLSTSTNITMRQLGSRCSILSRTVPSM
jgi:Caspase domain